MEQLQLTEDMTLDRKARELLGKLGDLSQTQIFTKIESEEGLMHFDEILQEADGIILSSGNLGIDLPPEKIWNETWLAGFFYLPCNYELFVKQTLNMEMDIVMARV
ncbi:Pyruvate kinase [Capsicum chinense]|nr:Pyruvate kinase [Capsicum chinense]